MLFRGFFLCLIGVLGSFCVPAAAVSDSEEPDKLALLIVRSGLEAQILDFPKIFRSGVNTALLQSGASGATATAIADIVAHEIRPERFLDEVTRQLDQDLSEADLRSLLGWVDSPLGQKIVRLESLANASGLRKAAARGAKSKWSRPVEPRREVLYRQLDDVIRTSEATLLMILNSQIAVATAFIDSYNGEVSIESARIRERIEAQRFRFRGLVAHQVHLSFVETYQSLSVLELESYIRQASTPAGRRFTAAVLDALNRSLTASFRRVGTRMRAEFFS